MKTPWQTVASHMLVLAIGGTAGFFAGRWTAPEEQLDSAGLAKLLAPLATIPVIAEVRTAPAELPPTGGIFDVSVRIESATAVADVTFRLEGPGGKSRPGKVTGFKPVGKDQWAGVLQMTLEASDPAGIYTVREAIPHGAKGEEGLMYDEPEKPAAVVRKR